MEISFYLKRPKALTETAIWARISYNGTRVKYYLTEKINPKFWNPETHRAKQTGKFIEYPEFNQRLDSISSTIRNTIRTFQNNNDGDFPSPGPLKDLLDSEFKKVQPEKDDKSFFGLFETIIAQSESGVRVHPKTGTRISANTIKTYKTTRNNLREFEAATNRKIDFDAINLDFYQDYKEFLMKGQRYDAKKGQSVSINLSINSIGKHIKILKVLLNEATERGINTNTSFKGKRFVTLKEKSESIYLTQGEINEIESLDLSADKRLDRVRDLFLIGCYSGLRYSDYSILNPENIKDGLLELKQAKTRNPVVIPIHDKVREIVAKYDGTLPKAISNQKTNEYLKLIGQKVDSLKTKTSKACTKGGLEIVTVKEKWEFLQTHSARRSFATNEYLAGTPAITIMAITGHKTESAFLGYIKLTPSEHAKLLKLHWQKRSILKVS